MDVTRLDCKVKDPFSISRLPCQDKNMFYIFWLLVGKDVSHGLVDRSTWPFLDRWDSTWYTWRCSWDRSADK